MKLPDLDPIRLFPLPLPEIGGLRESEQVRRGMWLHATLPRPPIGVSPHEVVHRQRCLAVRYYAPKPPARATPVIVVPSLINKAAICDLEPDRSLVRGLAERGHPVYLVDWGEPGPEDAGLGVAFALLDMLHRAVDRACRHARAERGVLLGYCQGGTLAAMYAALRPQRVAALAVFNAPFDFSKAGRFRRFVAEGVFDPEGIDPDRLMPTSVMAAAFKLLDPMGNWTKFIAIERAASDPATLARVLARERWLEENVAMPGTFAREFIRNAYQEDRLLAGTWEVGGERVDLKEIRVPALVCAAEGDFIAPAESVLPLAQAVGSASVRAEVLKTGHIGVVVGSFGPKVFYPLLDAWFREASP